ncbi:hypothetical protein SESBI_23400 [Sesbania bispinosa]|nr:hypothetical protein SESBI_23400 [Sesbania bispinosa]
MGGGSLKDMDGGPNSAGSKVSDFNTSGSWRRRQGSENEDGLFSTPTETEALLLWSQGGLFDIKDKGEPRKKILHLPYAKEGAAMWIFSLGGGYCQFQIGEH